LQKIENGVAIVVFLQQFGEIICFAAVEKEILDQDCEVWDC
jgi:hypothetical protein